MTLTPLAAAWFSIAAPEPESRLVRRMILAPLVMACSACCCWVDLSPWAFWISTGTPAALNACSSSGRSAVSHRTELLVSGSSTATLPALGALFAAPVDAAVDDELSSFEPHAATPNAVALSAAATASARGTFDRDFMCISSWWMCAEHLQAAHKSQDLG